MKLPAALNGLLENEYVKLIRETFSEWSKDKASRLAAALAYFTLFSLAPLLVIATFIAGLVFGEAAVRGQLVSQIEGVVGTGTAEMIQTMMASAEQNRSGGIVATLIGVAMLLFGALGFFNALEDALNTVWNVKPKKKGFWETIKDRLLSFTMILGIGLLLLVSFAISALLSALVSAFTNVLPGSEFVWLFGNYLISFVVITVLFAAIYKVLPDRDIAWRDVWVGAAATSLLFVIGKELIGFYLGQAAVGSAYGAAASLVVLLVWLYYSAQLLLFGAEFTQVWAGTYGSEKDKAPTREPEREPAPPEPRAVQPAPENRPQETGMYRPGRANGGFARFGGVMLGIAFGWMLAKIR
jgi:membrane protein